MSRNDPIPSRARFVLKTTTMHPTRYGPGEEILKGRKGKGGGGRERNGSGSSPFFLTPQPPPSEWARWRGEQ